MNRANSATNSTTHRVPTKANWCDNIQIKTNEPNIAVRVVVSSSATNVDICMTWFLVQVYSLPLFIHINWMKDHTGFIWFSNSSSSNTPPITTVLRCWWLSMYNNSIPPFESWSAALLSSGSSGSSVDSKRMMGFKINRLLGLWALLGFCVE